MTTPITFNGETHSLTEWASRLGLSKQALDYRLRQGWNLSEVLTSQRRRRSPETIAPRGRHITHDGVSRTVTQWSEHTGLSKTLINYRLRSGWTVANALDVPAQQRRPKAPGVSQDFHAFEGTGAGAVAQEMPNITFSEDAQS